MMITLTARCPFCQQTFRTELAVGQSVECLECGRTLCSSCPVVEDATSIECVTCPSSELFVRKDFPQRLGVTIVVTGFVLSSVAWYYHQVLITFSILLATAFVDVLLYVVMNNVLECYRCHAQYRGFSSVVNQHGFDLEIHEKYRQQAARLTEQEKQADPTLDSSRPFAP